MKLHHFSAKYIGPYCNLVSGNTLRAHTECTVHTNVVVRVQQPDVLIRVGNVAQYLSIWRDDNSQHSLSMENREKLCIGTVGQTKVKLAHRVQGNTAVASPSVSKVAATENKRAYLTQNLKENSPNNHKIYTLAMIFIRNSLFH